jgi:hypothetical protein
MEDIILLRNEIIKLPDLNDSSITMYIYTFDKLIDIYDIELLNYVFYNEKKYIHNKTFETNYRKDYKFKKEVIERYKSCIVTGKSIKICEVAHIVPFNKCLNEISKYDPDNGLLLCNELHKLFDTETNDFKINPDTQCIEFIKDIMEDEGFQDYHQFNGKPLKIKLNENSIRYLKQKYNN